MRFYYNYVISCFYLNLGMSGMHFQLATTTSTIIIIMKEMVVLLFIVTSIEVEPQSHRIRQYTLGDCHWVLVGPRWVSRILSELPPSHHSLAEWQVVQAIYAPHGRLRQLSRGCMKLVCHNQGTCKVNIAFNMMRFKFKIGICRY